MSHSAIPQASSTGRHAAILVLGVFLAACGGAQYQTTAATPPSTAAQDTMRVTVQEVNPQAGWVDCLYGVGLAVRVARVHVEPDTRVMVDGARASLAVLSPGDILFIRYSVTAKGDLASEIRKVGHLGSEDGGGR